MSFAFRYLPKAFALLAIFCVAIKSVCGEREELNDGEFQGVSDQRKEKPMVYALNEQPRMYTSGGHLYFETGTSCNISFLTNGQGRVNLNDEDLIGIVQQVKQNQADIKNIGSVPSDIAEKVEANTIAIGNLDTLTQDLDVRMTTLEADVQDLKTKVEDLTNKLETDHCQSNTCQNQGTCISIYDDHLCQCTDQWQGKDCTTDVDECNKYSLFGLPCQNGGTCVNKPGTFECTCPPDFFGPFCSSQYDDCTDGSAKCVHGLCVDNPRDDPSTPKYSCICNDGWDVASDTNPACTKDKDECLEKPCSKNPEVQCYNNPGSYTCGPCPSGFVGDGWACTDINECATNNGGCSVTPSVICHNSPGSYYCGPCPSGYTGDGFVCTVLDACTVNNGGCHPLATCTTNPAVGSSSVICTCPIGYTGNGFGSNGCTAVDCTSSCANGQCSDISGDLVCVCDPGWNGVNCDSNIDECVSDPCQFGGTCIDGVNGYYCQCQDGFTGDNCETQQSGCGAYYRQDSGAFSFPTTTGQTYPPSSSCAWVVEVSAGKVIQCTFPLFEIENTQDCTSDFLQIHDGNSASAHQIGKYCGTTVPGDPLVSTHNLLYFWFYANSQNNMKGFQVVWQTADPVCGEDITGQTYGDISSPGYPGDYPINTDCYWTIQVVPGNVVQLLFGALSMETHENCSYDFLEVRNGIMETDPVLARYCSSTTPPPLISTAPAVWIHFHSGPFNSDQGFHIVWSSQPVDINGCGGYFDDEDGIIISPNWPNPYESNQECFWQIHIRDSGQIVLNFTHIDIEEHEQCGWDFVEVRDGPNEAAPLAGRHCGQVPPPPFTSTSNDLWMRFRSDEAQIGAGFRATYTALCGGTYTAPEGLLMSPYYPEAYPSDKDCYYVIRQQPGYVVTLIFDDVDIEHEDNCQFDYIEVRDGSTGAAPLLARICGTSIPVPLMTTQNYMWVHMHSDPYYGGAGFKATYTSEYTGCGGVYTEPIGSLQSPGHPSPFPHGVNCTYYISVDPAFIINFDFISFSMGDPGTDGACDDFVEMFDGPSTTSPSLGRYCGSVPPPATVTNGYQMTVIFSSDEDINAEGFAAAYSTINASLACGKRLTDNQGLVTSPNYPENYYDMRTCVWTLTVDPTMQIQVNFTDFVFEGGNAEGVCVYDYLEIRNGGYDDSALIGTYCGTNSPGRFITHSNQMYMKMYTDPMSNLRGFLMYYDGSLTGCGGTLTSADGYFQSPNYPFAYNHNSECYWLIQVSEGSTIRLTFTTFDIETHGYCEFDYVEVYDGPTTGYPSLGRQCGSRLPPPYESSDNQLYVKFRSDPYVAGSGFMAQYHVECTRIIDSKSSGKIQSLDFPNNYPPNRDCAWTVKGSYGNRINITFSYFAMETCVDCSCDYIEIYDGEDINESPTLGRFCTGNPGPFRTQSDSFMAVFHTDPYIQAPGFEITWAVDGCGDTLTKPTGTITSPNYPNNYDDNRECIWQINSSPGTSVELTITVFDVEHHSQCDYDVLEVYNGRSIDASYLIVRLCNSGSSPHNLPMIVTSTSTFMTVRFLTDALVNGRGFSSTYREVPGICGGQLATSSGTITSPNYPGNYGQYQDCEWFIDVGEGSTVVVVFEAFDIEPEEICEFDYVALFDGNQTTDPMLLKACGTSIPDPVQSTGHKMLFQFHSDPYFTHTGFKATFSSGCGGKITSSTDGDIMSPNYPDSYPPSTNCTWTVQYPEVDGHITLTFTHMDMYFDPYSNATCGGDDFVQVLDGTSMTSPPYDLYCRTSLPPPITSLSRAFTVTMVSQSQFQRTGFRAIYSASTSRCGGELTAQSGYFNSPNYPDLYPSSTQCVWTLKSSPGNGITLSFLFFDVESQSNCLFDYVEIREGSQDGNVIMHACGNQLPSNLTTINGHLLYVIFRSDISTEGKGFQAAYQHTYGSTTIAEFDGAIASPMYPGLYPDETDAYYYIYAPAGRLISYTFTLFDLEPPTEEGCVYDYLVIYDGDTTDSPGKFFGCGNDFLPPPATSAQGVLLLWFHSDWGAHGTGFYMNWVATMGEGVPPNPTNVPTIPPGTCGAEQMVAAVYPIYFVSPGSPGLYPNNLDCIWVIEAAPQHTVMLTILFIDMESIDACTFDYMSIYNGPNVTSSLLTTVCGKRTPNAPIVSTSNYMTVLFHSDNSVGYLGFNASYQQGCGGVIISDLGAIESPNYPNDYPPDTYCLWDVVSTLGSNITLTFDPTYGIQNTDNANCADESGDYLMLLNGRDLDSPPLTPNNGQGSGRYCGSSPPQNLETQANGFLIVFKTDATGSAAGFRFTFTAELGDCGSFLHLTDQVTSGTLSSPNYPSTYPIGIDCYWIIEAPATEAVQLDFTTFSVEDHNSCQYDYVLVLDGRSGDGEVLGKFCGTTQPPTTKSIGNEMTVRFRSDPYVTAGGFQATYSLAACGGTLVGVGGSITSPEYPSNYPVSTSCSWVVRGPAYHFLSFDFDSVDLAVVDGAVCGDGTGDYLEFRTYNFTGPLLATVCGNAIPDTIDTVTNVVYITFVSDSANTASGFSMSYLASEDACGADLNSAGGSISTPNYPNAYDHARTCTWNIVVPDNRRVLLEFHAFAVEDPYEEDGVCYWDYIEVFNGINPNSPSLRGRICGSDMPAPFQSSGNTMGVVFVTDASVSNGGFLATYSSNEPRVCGGLLNSPNGGYFTTPNYPGQYGNAMECLWTIENPNNVNSTTLITFQTFAVENHVICDFDYVMFRAGATYDGFPVGTYCGHTKPDPFGIAYPQNFVQFISDPYVTDAGFNATYKFTKCGGIIGGTTNGVVTSPNYPDPYDNDDYCLWTIGVVEGHKVNLLFTDFQIEPHNSCVYDYLKIYNGPTIDSPLVGSYCGDNKPTEFQSGSNTVTLLFQSDYSVAHGGFSVEWSEDGSGCGNVIYHQQSGSFSSPNYPNSYPRNSDCIWQMIADPAYRISATLDENFYIEFDDACLYDFVAFYDGSSEFSPEITRYCGAAGDDTAPSDDPVQSSIQYLTVRFRTDFSTQRTGFKTDWEAVCGQTHTSATGTIQSPEYPSAYNNVEYCEFLITYDDDFKFIMLTFNQFNIEAGSGPGLCDYDFVQIYGGSDKSAPMLGSFCNNLRPTTPISSEGSMLVVFSTDPATVDYGFRATYESSDCGGMLTDSSGSINAFTHSDIHNNRNCTWQIEISPTNRLVDFRFSSFDLEAHSGCQYDYVKFYDGINTQAPLLGTYCGQQPPSHVLSTGNQLTFEYITDDLVTGNGFTGAYRAMPGPDEGCGGSLSGDTGTFSSIDLDNSGNYDTNLNCIWLIEVESHMVITLQFDSFRLENESLPGICGYDFVHIRDGASELDPLALDACGFTTPSPFRSSTNQLFVRFVSDPYITDTGFTATYTTSPTLCGGAFGAGPAYLPITSPQLSGLSQSLGCRWTIDAGLDTSQFVQINFLDLDVQSTSNQGSNCAVSYVELRDFPLGDYGQVRRYCGSDLPEDFISLDQVVQINLRADVGTTGSGFKLQYKVVGCTRNTKQPYGQLFSPGWPDPLAAGLGCQTIINVPDDNEIQLFFNFFNVEYEPSCNFDYLEIRNGSTADAPVIKRLCGNGLPDPVFVQSNEVFIQLVTDPYIEGFGYDITYTSSNNSCGGIVVGDHGSVYSTLYPQPYQPNTDCGFSIRTPAGRPATVHITFIDIYYTCDDNGCSCENDFLTIYGGPDMTYPAMSSYCGYGTLTDLKSPTNGAYIRLRTSDFPPGSRNNAGFRVDFES